MMVMMVVIVKMIVAMIVIVRHGDLALGITEHQCFDQTPQRIFG